MVSPISDNDVESELSYAYLHAIAHMAGASCTWSSRLPDNRGIDAQLTAWGPFPGGGDRMEVDLKIQLKATISPPADLGTHLSYNLKGVSHYDDLRKAGAYAVPRILVVLYLPRSKSEWLLSTPDVLTLKKCAYWVSLAGAGATANTSGVTVYLPKTQMLTAESLRSLFSNLSHCNVPQYDKPEEGR
jgi:hypothetical protein